MRPASRAPRAPSGSALVSWITAMAVVLVGGCDYKPKYQLLYERADVAPPPPIQRDVEPGTDVPVDHGILAVYDRHCSSCHPDYGRARGIGPELAGVLHHNGREETFRITYHGAGEMGSMESRITAQEGHRLVAFLATYGEGFQAPPTGDPDAGRASFDRWCAGCHVQGGASEVLIPEIRSVGAMVSREFLVELLSSDTGLMPAVPLEPDQVDLVVGYLTSVARGQAPSDQALAAFQTHCETCHVAGGARTIRVPTVGEGGHLSFAGLEDLAVRGQGDMPGVVPEARWSRELALDLQAYMRSVRVNRPEPGGWPPLGLPSPDPSAALRGGQVYGERCAGCHGALGEPPKVWPDLRDAGYLHSPKYLAEIIGRGAGDMPGFPNLSDGDVQTLVDYMVTLSKSLRRDGDVSPPSTPGPFREHCEACHQDGGRTGALVPVLDHVGRDLSPGRLREAIAQGVGFMPGQGLPEADLDTLVAFFQQGLADPSPSEQEMTAARSRFQRSCEGCHHDGGLAPTGIPGVGTVMGRASEKYLRDIVTNGLGWMPAISGVRDGLDMLTQGLVQVAGGRPMSAAARAAYDTNCGACHLEPDFGDSEGMVATPTVVTTVGGRLSPGFIDSISEGMGSMGPVPGTGLGEQVYPYLASVANADLHDPTGIPGGGDRRGAEEVFGRLCEGCHRDRGRAEVVMPPMQIKYRFLSQAYVMAFVDDPFGDMPRIPLTAQERASVEAFVAAAHSGGLPSREHREVYQRKCAGCHPMDPAAPAIRVPHLTMVAGRLSARAVIQASVEGIGTMNPAYEPDGSIPDEATIRSTFPHLAWLAGQEPERYSPPELDAAAVTRGRNTFRNQCAACHGDVAAGGFGFSFYPGTVSGNRFVPLAYLSPELLTRVTRNGLGDMPAVPSGQLSDSALDDLVTYLRHLGLDQGT